MSTTADWVWIFQRADSSPVETLPASAVTSGFPTQSDAEAWLGESWRELLAGGVDMVSLYEGDRCVYADMSLHPPD